MDCLQALHLEGNPALTLCLEDCAAACFTELTLHVSAALGSLDALRALAAPAGPLRRLRLANVAPGGRAGAERVQQALGAGGGGEGGGPGGGPVEIEVIVGPGPSCERRAGRRARQEAAAGAQRGGGWLGREARLVAATSARTAVLFAQLASAAVIRGLGKLVRRLARFLHP